MSTWWRAAPVAIACVLFATRAVAQESAPRTTETCEDGCFTMKLEGGPSYRSFRGMHVTSADFRVALGGRGRRFAGYAIVGGTYGETGYGLMVRSFVVGAAFEAIFDRFRIGAAIHHPYMTYRRATTGEQEPAFGFSLRGFVTFDVVSVERHGIYIGADLAAEYIGGASMFGTTGLVGLRF